MTIPEFLKETTKSKSEIAEACGVDVSQVYRWEKGETVPSGLAVVKLIEMSGGTIKSEDVPSKKRGARRRVA